MSVRAHLVALVLAALLPVILFSGLVVVLLAKQQQANVERGLRETCRALALAVDEHVRSVVASLETLATSALLDRGDLRAFHRRASRTVPTQDGWIGVGLIDPSGRIVLNTLVPYGTPLMSPADRPYVREVLASGRPYVSDLLTGRVSGRAAIAISLPVLRGGRLRYVLAATVDPQSFTRILREQRIAAAWTGAILDRQRVIIARSRAAETMIGRPATSRLAAATREAEEGSFWDVTQEGSAAYGAFSRSPKTGWTVVLGVPAETVAVASRSVLWMVVAGGVGFLFLAFALAGLVGRRIARPIGALAEAAAALGRGERPVAPESSVAEVDRVAREIEDAAARRHEAEAERAELLARERAARAEAEAAVRRTAFLAEASRVLASSLDYESTFQSVAALAVRELAELCVVDLLEPNGSLRRVAVAHADPERLPTAQALKDYPPDPSRRHHPVLEVIRTGRPSRLDDLTPASYATIARDEAHLRVLEALGIVSVLFVPLAARGRTLGVLWLGTSAGERRIDAADLALAEDLGRRAGVAVDNARLYREAQDAVRVRDAFLARASHELRTPLTSVVATLRLLGRAMSGRLQAQPAELIAIASRNLDAMLALINNLLDASKLAAGQDALAVEPVDLDALVSLSLDLVGVQARDKGVEVRRTVAPGLSLAADRLKLEQVLANLVANAIKFTPPGGIVEVQASREAADGAVLIRVRDTGVGIAPEHLERIFEPFFQARLWGAARGARGTGLGLAICRQIVTLHGGRIWAESDGPGTGSTFVVRLPAVPGSARAA